MFKVGDRVKYTGTIYGVNNEIGTVVGYNGELNVVHYPNVKNAFLHNCGVFNEYEYLYISNCNLELVDTNKGDKDMIKVGDLVTYNGNVLAGALGLVGLVVKILEDSALIYYPAVEDGSDAGVLLRFHDCDGKYSEKKYLAIPNKNIKKVEIGQKLERVDGDGPFNFFKPGTEVTLLEHVDNKIVYVSGHVNGLKCELKQAVSIAQLRIKEETATLGGDNMIKAGDLVKVLNAEDDMIWEVIKVVKDVAQVINDDIAQVEIFALENLEKVVEENDEKMAVYTKDIFNIGDRVVANCTSDKGNYRIGDTGTVVKFRDDKDGADVGVKFDHKKDTITTWVYPENIIPEDCTLDFSYFEEDVAPAPVEYGMIKIFNLTSLRKNGWKFDNQGNLNLTGDNASISGLMLNIIDREFMAYEEPEREDCIYITDEHGIDYIINKRHKGILFKKI